MGVYTVWHQGRIWFVSCSFISIIVVSKSQNDKAKTESVQVFLASTKLGALELAVRLAAPETREARETHPGQGHRDVVVARKGARLDDAALLGLALSAGRRRDEAALAAVKAEKADRVLAFRAQTQGEAAIIFRGRVETLSCVRQAASLALEASAGFAGRASCDTVAAKRNKIHHRLYTKQFKSVGFHILPAQRIAPLLCRECKRTNRSFLQWGGTRPGQRCCRSKLRTGSCL